MTDRSTWTPIGEHSTGVLQGNKSWRAGDWHVKELASGTPVTEVSASRILDLLGIPGPKTEIVDHRTVRSPWFDGRGMTHMNAEGVKHAEEHGHLSVPRVGPYLFAHWLLHAEDRHGDQYLWHPDKGFHSIDYGYAYHPFVTSPSPGHAYLSNAARWHKPMVQDALYTLPDKVLTSKGKGHEPLLKWLDTPLPRGPIAKALKHHKEVEELARTGINHFPNEKDIEYTMQALRDRLAYIAPIAKSLTLHDLKNAHKPLVHKAEEFLRSQG